MFKSNVATVMVGAASGQWWRQHDGAQHDAKGRGSETSETRETTRVCCDQDTALGCREVTPGIGCHLPQSRNQPLLHGLGTVRHWPFPALEVHFCNSFPVLLSVNSLCLCLFVFVAAAWSPSFTAPALSRVDTPPPGG